MLQSGVATVASDLLEIELNPPPETVGNQIISTHRQDFSRNAGGKTGKEPFPALFAKMILEQNGCAVPNIGKLGRTELTKTITRR
jgi:hypothetical protein